MTTPANGTTPTNNVPPISGPVGSDSASARPAATDFPQIPRGKWRRFGKGCAILAVVLLFAWLIWLWTAERRLDRAIAALPFKMVPAKDLPTLWGPPPAESENAAPLLAEAWAALEPLHYRDDSPRPARKEFGEMWAMVDPAEDEDEPSADGAAAPKKPSPIDGRRATTEELARIEAFLATFENSLELMHRAAALPHYRTDTDWSDYFSPPSDSVMNQLNLYKLAVIRASLLAQQGRHDQAYAVYRDCFKTIRLVEQEPYLMGILITRASRAIVGYFLVGLMDQSPPAPAMADELRQLLETDPGLLARRTLTVEAVRLNEMAGRGLPQTYKENFLGKMASGLLTPLTVSMQAELLEQTGLLINAATRPVPAALVAGAAFESYDRHRNKLTRGLNQGQICLGSYGTFLNHSYRSAAGDRMMQIAIELAVWKGARGSYPAALGELPAAEKLPLDPFNEKPFGYARTPKGYQLWSVGPDLKDDGGREAGEIKADQSLSDGGDIVLRVPLEIR